MNKKLLGLTAGVLLTGLSSCEDEIEQNCSEFSITDLRPGSFFNVDGETRTDNFRKKIIEVCEESPAAIVIGTEIGETIELNAGILGDGRTTTVLVTQAETPQSQYDLEVACITEGQSQEVVLTDRLSYFKAQIVEVCPKGL